MSRFCRLADVEQEHKPVSGDFSLIDKNYRTDEHNDSSTVSWIDISCMNFDDPSFHIEPCSIYNFNKTSSSQSASLLINGINITKRYFSYSINLRGNLFK
jgi:hypothetical protein